MTAGQGGGPYGPPQGWNAPPGPPPYGQQSPGYAPTSQEPPLTVRAGIGAFVAGIVMSLVIEVVRLLNWDTLFGPALNDSLGQLSQEEADLMAGLTGSLDVVTLVIGLVFTAVYAVFVWFAWRGHNWARVVLWILAGLGVAFSFLELASGGTPLPIINALTAFEMLFDAVGITLLALKPSSDWFRLRRWQRATGQG